MLGFRTTGGIDANFERYSMGNLFAQQGKQFMYSSDISPNIDITAIIINEDIRQENNMIKKFIDFFGYLHPGL